ncbi:transporter substrate-binding domain-containing protein [Pseudomonas sp. TNT2022 ID1048]|uniref:substrate-binding periplasmic protein n=1 Tax=Pseudomonas idahonensis TaxID=2942628 RepID=UPI00235F6862|nr:transporter substrate-binding domain-containing protein [Pseudomonas idahonensis]MDD1020600.1 transporter substrate-binding domain-containing protein [Pseudomonas idahonensis]
MHLTWGALLLLSTSLEAAEAPLRFVIADSWAMPTIEVDGEQPTAGILYDTMNSLARHMGTRAEFHVLARARVQNAMAQGEVDVRCFAAQAWLPNLSGDYLWSVPLFVQRNLLVSNRYHHEPINPQQLPTQHIGTVLSYTYTSLQPLFESAQLIRDDARNEEQVLQKLQVGRYQYAIASQWTLDWFNKTQSSGKPLHRVALLQEQAVGCYVRNDPAVPTQRILRTLLKMKMSGEIDAIVQRYVDPQTGAQASDTVSP